METSTTDARECLIADAREGGITLVLGAGVSGACNVATWRELAVRLWVEAFGCELPEVADDPRFYPFVFERVREAMPQEFARRLKETLYAEHGLPSRHELATSKTNTLAVLARAIARESRARLRRVVRVITLNVDDLLERAVEQLAGDDPPPLRPIARASFNATQTYSNAALPIYHLHGYLRSQHDLAEPDEAPDVLVFTDMQYWASAAVPSSHMNRTFSFALHDSHCVFIGTSMTDLNVWRWLALRTFEIAVDRKNQCEAGQLPPEDSLEALYRRSLDRHYWITSSKGTDTFLSECLALRGVRTVRIGTWQDASLHDLMAECFPQEGGDL